jgi:hypothetical protein
MYLWRVTIPVTHPNLKEFNKYLFTKLDGFAITNTPVRILVKGIAIDASYYDIPCTREEIYEIVKTGRLLFQEKILYFMLSEFVYFE